MALALFIGGLLLFFEEGLIFGSILMLVSRGTHIQGWLIFGILTYVISIAYTFYNAGVSWLD